MNKNEMIKEVQQQLGCDENFSQKVINIFESCSEIGQKGKDQVVSRYVKELNIGETEANNIFDCVLNLIKKGIKDKLKNDDLGNKRIFVPFLVIAKNKEILATDDETSTLSSDKVDPLKYWTKEEINALEEKLKPAIEKIKICNECNK